jgi:Patched family
MQQQMRDYVDELAALPQIGEEAPFCWVRDFPTIAERFPQYSELLKLNLTFTQQVRAALAHPTIREIYGEDIVIDEETGEITASRCLLFLRNVDLTDVEDQVDMLYGQREVTEEQRVNQGIKNYKFFSFDKIFFYWELYAQAVTELTFTIFSGVVAVAFVTFILIPHWSAAFFVCPGIVILYCNFLGEFSLKWHLFRLKFYVFLIQAASF